MGTTAAPEPGRLRRLTTAEAMVDGIATEMDADPSVLYLGEDVGIFGSATGLRDRFGPKRVIDAPVSASAFIGRAGEDMRPSTELRWVDVMRTCQCQCQWGTFAHLPGMKVVAPSNPYDAKGLIISAVRDDNPVVCILHKGVLGLTCTTPNPYATAEVPDVAYEVPIGRAAVARSGTDVTVVTASLSVHHTLEAAETLSGQSIDVEVIDLRSLVPLDRNAILDSVARTGRLVVVDEDYRSYGMSGEVVATVADADPSLLRAPVQRVANPDSPIPYARELEHAALPRPDRIEAAIRQVLAT